MGRFRQVDLPVADTAGKKDRLTLDQLAAYDDILTDALVDHVYFWTTIRKNRNKYSLTRGINEDDVTHVLLHDLIVAKDVPKAEARLLQLPGLRKSFNNLRTDRERDDFKRHMRKYVNMWLPDCPFEVSTTNRYTIFTHEAATTARRPIRSGETIKYLCGNLVAMTTEEEQDINYSRRDFSVVLSSRKKIPSLFLGPARFSNHDCNANARLVTKGAEGMTVLAVRNIDVGTEITVNYGTNYFGEDNCECLCATCESKGRGGWDPENKVEYASSESTLAEELEEKNTVDGVRGRKRNASEAKLDSLAPNANDSGPVKKRKVEIGNRLAGNGLGSLSLDISANRSKASESRRKVPISTIGISKRLAGDNVKGSKGAGKSKGQSTIQAESHQASTLAPRPVPTPMLPQPDCSDAQQKLLAWMYDAGTAHKKSALTKHMFFHARIIDIPNYKGQSESSQKSTSPSENSSIFDHQHHASTPDTTPSTVSSSSTRPLKSTNRRLPSPSPSPSPSTSSLSSVPTDVHLSDTDFEPSGKPLAFNRLHARSTARSHPLSTSAPMFPTIEAPPHQQASTIYTATLLSDTVPLTRTPGDYIRTRLLLSLNHSRWVDCRTCASTWVQANGYQTRKECPRCERHSKLYGYQWPKTENGRGEKDERVLDHRTVHRFISHDEEREEKKRGRGVFSSGVGGIVGGVEEGSWAGGVIGGGGGEGEREGRGRRMRWGRG